MTHPINTQTHKHVLQEVFVLQYQSKDCLYFVYVFHRCVQIFKRQLNLYIRYFPHRWADTTHPIVHKAHKHVLQEVLALQYQSKHWRFFAYVFHGCV